MCFSVTSSTTTDDDPTTYFRDFSTSYLEDRISHVSEDVNPMAHFHDSFASTAGDTSSSVSKDVGSLKQIKGVGVVKVQASDVQLETLDWMSNSKDNQQEMDREQKIVSDNFSLQQAIRKFGLQRSSNVVSGVTSGTEFEPLQSFSPNSSASFAEKHFIMEENDSSALSTVDDLEQNSLPSGLSLTHLKLIDH
ncbi:hypothetical protein L3X38_028661 [Prunus dulcis]|uniref:Uncharacterized protein n=1 Tax=Prunus dulcis TaxID=3755 RepID=A0AAD4VQ58_PRUDU|nr:hypothetical protein L3X38_028661 [Prunus dulcis]